MMMSRIAIFRAASWLPSLVIAAVALFAMVALGYALLLVAPENPAGASPNDLAGLLPLAGAVAPEPRDQFMFLTLLLAVPVILVCIAIVSHRCSSATAQVTPIFWLVVVLALAIAVFNGAVGRSEPLFSNGQWIGTAGCFLAAGCAAFALDSDIVTERAVVWSGLLVAAEILLGLRLWTAHTIDYGGIFTSHYQAAIFSAVRIAAGQTCLAEVLPQYGCYGEYLSPLLRIAGSSTLAVTAIFTMLQITAVGAIIAFSQSVIRSPALLLACVLCVLIEAVLNLWPSLGDPVLQYHPLRLIFPAISLLAIIWLQRNFSWRRTAAAGLFGGAAITWNLESGLAVFIALGLFAALGDLALPAWENRHNFVAALKRTGGFVLAGVLYAVAFLCYLHVKSGGTSEIANYFVFQRTFLQIGFGMIPLPPFPDYWKIHAALILALLMLAALRVGRGPVRDKELERAAYLAILAIGLSPYYVGRSHWLVLKLVAWPDGILLAFLADRALHDRFAAGSKRAFSRSRSFALFMVKTSMIALPAAFLAYQAPSVWMLVQTPRTGDSRTRVEEDIAFIGSRTRPGEAVYILALNQGTLYGETGTRPVIKGPGLAEMLRNLDLADANADIAEHGPAKLFVGTGLEQAAFAGTLAANVAVDFTRLRKYYVFAERGPGDRVWYLRRRPFDGPDLFEIASK